MNFKINKKAFLDALIISNKALSPTIPLPILSGIYLNVKKEAIVLTSSDSNISIQIELNNIVDNILQVFEEGEIVIDSRYILEIVRKIPGSDISIETIDGSLLRISGGNSEFKLNCTEASEYPKISFLSASKPFEIEGKILKSVVDDTIFACSDSMVRPVLTGVNLKASANTLRVAASDSYRVALRTVMIDYNGDFNITVPSKYLNDICNSINEADKVYIQIDNQKIIFKFANTLILTRLLDDEFPNVMKLIPASSSHTLVLNRNEFKSAIDRASFIKTEGKNIIKLSINDSKVDITSFNNQSSSFESIKVLSFSGEPLDITCRGNYLQDALSTFKSDEVILNFSGPLKPIIISSKEDNNLIQLVSPFRSY